MRLSVLPGVDAGEGCGGWYDDPNEMSCQGIGMALAHRLKCRIQDNIYSGILCDSKCALSAFGSHFDSL
ncbi:hypothetical protein M378DRAFT_162237 [Amanita muscaria Koide BX008]|uniref:Uncharacterized protein n=1 Tax=Amanita muscaria (strain Koide BX008) TaxID=946122 RepID=A0A0C2X7M0_AMAMK|nr:hypothetical protein M378DRAFT_162237 [Amanita muscaria Koide BX008]